MLLGDRLVAAELDIEDGRITAIRPLPDEAPRLPGTLVVPDGLQVLPGNVDTHVHINEPGRTEWEGFATATRAAALGGVTTLVDMPLNSIPPTIDVASLRVKQAAARDAL
uniref:amidohydrolase family protein n=2 Tax=Bacillati TaxID=1783272 RepID=UPI001C3C926A